ncbi:WapI family immunity protein [Enterococcus sp. LJL51]|uniref:WapI family immunity protein n=1 Tax=Enterococcus sp. LJL51 TaxID=3416656 RepID=UPI003CF5FDE8
MPKLVNEYQVHDLILDFNLVKNSSFIYNPKDEEYLNWIPVELKLQAGENSYTYKRTPTFSLEALRKYFIGTLEKVLKENEELNQSFVEKERETYHCGATEGEFWFELENSSEEIEKEIIYIRLWLNVVSMTEQATGYDIGFSFIVLNRDLAKFVKELKQQVYDLTNGDVDIPGR